MNRFVLATVLLIPSMALAQEAKPKPPAKPRIAIDDPSKLKDDRDFQLQGEYTGKTGAGQKDQKESGLQLIAKAMVNLK